MLVKDFSILMEPVLTQSSKKDIGIVSGYNAYAQYIENVLRTQKKEVVSNMNFGTDYFTYIFGANDPTLIEDNLAAYIQTAIPQISQVLVTLVDQDANHMTFRVTFTYYDGIKYQSNIACLIEVPV